MELTPFQKKSEYLLPVLEMLSMDPAGIQLESSSDKKILAVVFKHFLWLKDSGARQLCERSSQ